MSNRSIRKTRRKKSYIRRLSSNKIRIKKRSKRHSRKRHSRKRSKRHSRKRSKRHRRHKRRTKRRCHTKIFIIFPPTMNRDSLDNLSIKDIMAFYPIN